MMNIQEKIIEIVKAAPEVGSIILAVTTKEGKIKFGTLFVLNGKAGISDANFYLRYTGGALLLTTETVESVNRIGIENLIAIANISFKSFDKVGEEIKELVEFFNSMTTFYL
jgi:hypothetical protein